MGGLLGDIFGTARDIRRGTREIGGVFREVGRTSDEIARARGAVEGHGGVKDEAEYRREERGDRSFSRAARARAEREAIENGNDDRDDRRGDFIRDPRRAGLGSAQRDDGRGGRGQGQDPRYAATEEYVDMLAEAAQTPPGSPERAAALKKAEAFLTNDEHGLIQPDGSIQFPEGMKVGLGAKGKGISFEGDYSYASSASESVQRGVNAVAEQKMGYSLTDADIAALRGAPAPTVAVGTGEQPKPSTPDAPAPGAAKPDAPGVASFALPEASGPTAKIYTKNGEGRTMNAEDAPKISASQVKAIQEKLDVKADEMWGPNTQAAFAAAAAKAGVKPSDVDFTNPNDPDTIKIMAHFNAGASPAAGAAVTAAPAATTEAERLTTASEFLTQLAGENKTLTADDIAVMGQDKAAVETTAKTFDLNGNGSVEQTELEKIVAAANGVDIRGGAATLAPMFAGVTVPATGVAESIQYVSNPVIQPLQTDASQTASQMIAALDTTKPVTPTDEAMFVVKQSGLVETQNPQVASGPSATVAQTQTPSELFANRGFSSEAKEAALEQMGFKGIVKDGKLSEAELAMGGKLEAAAGTVGMVDDREALGRLQEAAQAAQKGGSTLAARAEANEVYNPTSHKFTAAPPTPDARTQAQRDNARAGLSA